jgi:hypothetical protein
MATNPRLSFKGYSLATALYRNKDSIKGILAILGGINFVLGFNWKTLLISLAGAFSALLVKLITDAVDYYFSEVTIDPVTK